jgi:hypothetical protein
MRRTLVSGPKVVAGTLGLLAVACIGLNVPLLERSVVEQWHIRRLANGNEEAKRSSASALVRIKSRRAAPILASFLRSDAPRTIRLASLDSGEITLFGTMTFAYEALLGLGDSGVKELEGLLEADDERIAGIALVGLLSIGLSKRSYVTSALRIIAESRDEILMYAAVRVLHQVYRTDQSKLSDRYWAHIVGKRDPSIDLGPNDFGEWLLYRALDPLKLAAIDPSPEIRTLATAALRRAKDGE